MAPILNQGSIGTCVPNSFSLYINTITRLKVSRLYHYAVTRSFANIALSEDSGLSVRDAAKVLANYGLCQESLWPYDVTKYTLLPPLNAFQKSITPSDRVISLLIPVSSATSRIAASSGDSPDSICPFGSDQSNLS